MVDFWASPVGLRAVIKTELFHPAVGAAEQSGIGRAAQLLPGENNNRMDYLAETDNELPQVPYLFPHQPYPTYLFNTTFSNYQSFYL
jgi:hypothetical protein